MAREVTINARVETTAEIVTSVVKEKGSSQRPVVPAVIAKLAIIIIHTTVEAAAYWFITMERSCQAQLAAEAAGKPILIPHESASYTQQLTGFPESGWFQFQPLFQEICATDPELFE